MRFWLTALVLLIPLLLNPSTDAMAENLDPENTLVMELDSGKVTIQLRPDLAPNHVARIKELTRKGFYDGLLFHRVIGGFMAQGGDPEGTGRGGTGEKLKAEFSSEPFRRGTVGMARAGHPDSGDSQFFISYTRVPHLDNQYTVWGQVVDGMIHVGRLPRGEPPSDPGKIIRLRVLADVK